MFLCFHTVFLHEIAIEHGLSPQENAVFILRFGGQQGSPLAYEAIAQILNISDGAVQKRMSQVYKKMKILGDNKGKETLLIKYLKDRYKTFDKASLLIYEDIIVNSPQIASQEISSLKLQIASLQESILSLENFEQSVPIVWDEVEDFIDSLILKLKSSEESYSSQDILKELAAEVPKMIEKKAAEGKYTERELTLLLLQCTKKFFLNIKKGSLERYRAQLNQSVNDVDKTSL
ncbi:hypothetical protein IFO70_30070 [Phormidium tenue FACHB-886]|nr:hypothetical protein [Phormidium tenue FACHB-886]